MLVELLLSGAMLAHDPIATVETGEAKIELYEQRGDICPKGTLSARFIAQNVYVVPGCYVIDGERVLLWWADGDAGNAHIKRFTWKPGKAPSTL